MKYIYIMLLAIWKNFFVGRPKVPLICICLIALYSTAMMMVATMMIHWAIGLFFGILGWLFAVPTAICLIDGGHKKNPDRPKSLKNLWHTLTGQ